MNKEETITLDEFRATIKKGFHTRILKRALCDLNIEPLEYGVVVSWHKYSYSDLMRALDYLDTKNGEKNVGEFLYMFKIYKDDAFIGKVKIGLARNVINRLKYINSECKKIEIEFRLYLISERMIDAEFIEKSIHSILTKKNLHYIPFNKFAGYNEIFEYEEWMDNLIPFARKVMWYGNKEIQLTTN